MVAIIEKKITKTEKIIAAIISSDEETKRIYQLIVSVPGVGLITAIYLIIVTQNFTILNNGRKFSNYGTMAPHKNQSGMKKGRDRLSYLGDKKIKSLLSNGVKTNLKYDTETKEYFVRKKAEGKVDGIIINNLKNKLIHRVCAVVNRGTPYVNIKKYRA